MPTSPEALDQLDPQNREEAGRLLDELDRLPLPGLIGREDKLNELLAKRLHREMVKFGDYTPIRQMHRGRWFQIRGEDGHVWRVSVVLDRMEPESTARQEAAR